jgi:hypothetical protein
MEDETEAITIPLQTSTAIARPTTPRALVMAEALKEDTEQRVILAEYVEHHMTEGVDYGAIPGTPQEVEIFVGGKKKKMRKNNLLKPGAEKLLDLFRCRAEYEFLSRDVDRATGLYAYEVRCKAINRETGTVLNEGLGSASSFESKHRYRNSERVCPQCGKPNIRKSKPPKEGWYCWEKTGGCGANFPKDDPDILDQAIGKMVNPDLADVANTVLKMAKKRAQVDCAIALARVSDIFAQDVEDLEPNQGSRQSRPQERAPNAQGMPKTGKSEQTASMRAQALWSEACERIGKTKTLERWNQALGDLPRDKSKWSDADFVKLSNALFPEEADVLADEEQGPIGPDERQPGEEG